MQSELKPVTSPGWRMGFGNLMRRELSQYFGTRTAIRQLLVTTIILGGLVYLVMGPADMTTPPEERIAAGVLLYTIFASIFPGIIIVISSTGAILEERERGTAAWVLSKPVSRTSFILSKMFVGIVTFGTLLLIPGLVVYAIIYATGGALSLGAFILGLGPLLLWYTFLHFLCVCLGTIFNSAGPVAGPTAISLFFVQSFDLSGIAAFTPWTLTLVAQDLMQELPVPTLAPVISTLVILVVLLLIAIWRFDREEF
jgi:ABC-2 type transport system permease protein